MNLNKQKEVVYALLDEDGRPRYVGRSYLPQQRLASHYSGRGSNKRPMGAWLRSLAAPPKMVILEEFSLIGRPGAGDGERKWIEHYRSEGFDLFNEWPWPVGESPAGITNRTRRAEERAARVEVNRIAVIAMKQADELRGFV